MALVRKDTESYDQKSKSSLISQPNELAVGLLCEVRNLKEFKPLSLNKEFIFCSTAEGFYQLTRTLWFFF